ncbi:MAG: lysophospholipid acyltransferase family protein [Fusobacteriaceae bacterium]
MLENKKFRFYGNLVYYLVKILEKTMKIEQVFPKEFNKDRNYVMALWHNKVVMTLLGTGFIKRKVALASPTKDGELISVPLEKYGTEMVRGSSDKNPARSLLKLIKKVKEGCTVGTPVDGPRGPRYVVKSGMLYVSQKSKVPLVPIGVAYEKKWIFEKSWDKFELPKPFSRAVIIYGEPYFIDENANLEVESLLLKEKIDDLDRKAELKIKNKEL